jgi:Serine aminopeptidase, S33
MHACTCLSWLHRREETTGYLGTLESLNVPSHLFRHVMQTSQESAGLLNQVTHVGFTGSDAPKFTRVNTLNVGPFPSTPTTSAIPRCRICTRTQESLDTLWVELCSGVQQPEPSGGWCLGQVKNYLEDPLNFIGMVKARVASELLKGFALLANSTSKYTLPILALHGDADKITSFRASPLMSCPQNL